MVSILHVFVLSVSFLWHSVQLITLVHVLVSSYGHQTAKSVCGSTREAFVLDEICEKDPCFFCSSFEINHF